MEELRLGGGLLAAWVAGLGLLAIAGLENDGPFLARQARAGLLGLCTLAVAWVPLTLCAVRFDAATIVASALLLGLPAWWRWPIARAPACARAAHPSAESTSWRIAAATLVAAAAGLFVWKTLAAPLWSWDHFAIWGVKARWFAAASDAGKPAWAFLRLESLAQARPDHPLGLPMAWLVLGLGGVPSTLTFKAAHLACGGSLLALLHGALRRRGWAPTPVLLLVAFAALSPLFWDTGNVGLAEMLLAAVALAAADLLFDPEPRGARTVVAGALIGFLPWIKQEGSPLAVLLAGAALVAVRAETGRWWRPGLAPAMVLPACGIGTALWLQRALTGGEGAGYLGGDWLPRGVARLPQLGAMARAFAGELLVRDWLGFWPLLACALAAAVWGRRVPAMALGAAVLVQLAGYFAVCVLTYVDPYDQIRAAAFRLAAPLLPLAMLALALPARGRLPAGAPGT